MKAALRHLAAEDDDPTWKVILTCIAQGVLAGVIFGAINLLVGSSWLGSGLFFAVFMSIFFSVVTLRNMRRGPWADRR